MDGPQDAREGAGVEWGAILMLVAVLAAWFGATGLRELLPADEGRYAQIAREMAASGDWVTVRYNGLKYFEKPPLHFWMGALAFDVFGVGIWQARLWVATSSLIGIGALMLACARWWGARFAGTVGLVMMAMPLWVLGGQFNSLDMGVSAALAVVLAAFMLAHHPATDRIGRRRWMLLAWAAMGVAVLSKGLIGVVLPGLVLTVYILWSRDWQLVKRLHLLSGLVMFAAITVPWFWLVSARNPEFLHFFFIQEHFQRYTTTMHGRSNPWWYFIPLLAVGSLPWAGLWWAMARGAARAASGRDLPIAPAPGPLSGVTPRAGSAQATIPASAPAQAGLAIERLLIAWAGSIFLFFSASGSKLPGYILPVLPALAVLAALALERLSERAWRRHLFMACVVALALAALSPLVGRMEQPDTPRMHFEALAQWFVAAAAIAAAAAAAAWWLARRSIQQSRAAYALGALTATLVAAVGHNQIGAVTSGVSLAPAVSRVLTEQMPLYGVRRLDHTLPFALQHRLIMVETPDELAFGVSREPERWVPTLAQFLDHWQHGPRALALMTPATFNELRDQSIVMEEVARDSRRVVVANFKPAAP